MLAIVWAVDQFRPYVFGREFRIRTDHKPLVWVAGLKENSARISKWKEKLAAYSFIIEHLKGKDNVVADVLSRYIGATSAEDEEEGSFAARYLEDWVMSRPDIGERRREEQQERVEGQRIPHEDAPINAKRNQLLLTTGETDAVNTQLHRYGPIRQTTIFLTERTEREELAQVLRSVIRQGKRYYVWSANQRLVGQVEEAIAQSLPERANQVRICDNRVETIESGQEQEELLAAYHVGKTNHRGANETVRHLQRRYYWLGMHKQVEDFVRKCAVCQRVKYDRRPLVPQQMVTPTPRRPGEMVECDLFFVDHQQYMTTIDRLTKLASAWPLESKAADGVKNALIAYFSTFNTPDVLISDQGREFNNRGVRQLLDELNIRHHMTTPGHPRSHGTIERFHSTLLEHIMLLEHGRGITGKEAMHRAVLAYNSTIHGTQQCTPFEAQGEARSVRDRIHIEKQRRTRKFNREAAEPVAHRFQIGDSVFVKDHYRRTKTDQRFAGPYVITGFLSHGRLQLRAQNTAAGRIIRHVKAVKRLRSPRQH